MPAADGSGPTFIGSGSRDAAQLARTLGASATVAGPEPPPAATWSWDWAEDLRRWRAEVDGSPTASRVVVCTWPDAEPVAPLVDLSPAQWRRYVEWPTALWFTTLVAAAGRCEDSGSVVAVVERPAVVDSVGHSSAVTVADGVTNVVRSCAASEAARGVRVNAVVAAAPARHEPGVAGAIRFLLCDDSAGLTGTVISASGGCG